MANRAKIFISSANERALKGIRSSLKDELTKAGHEALIFEDGDFAPWDRDTLQTCIDKVKECQIFILLIGHKAGTYFNDQKTTPTYIEFHTAVEEGLYIIPYVHEEVSELYFDFLRSSINEKINEHLSRNNGRQPESLEGILDELVFGNQYKDRLTGVDNFVWGFINQVERKCGWLYKFDYSNNTEFNENVKQYLSDQLGKSIQFVPLRNEIIENAKNAEEYKRFQKYTRQTLSLLEKGTVNNWESFLACLVDNLQSGEVIQAPDTYLAKSLGRYESCIAASLYEHNEGGMNLLSFCGRITPPESYKLDQQNSFVVDTFLKDTQGVYFEEDKELLYFTIKAGEFVLCFHFPVKGDWTGDKVNIYKKEIYEAILRSNSSLYLNFSTQILGGINNGA